MDINKPPQPFLANLFHEGNTCPSCQELIEMAQQVVKCGSCGSVQHLTCWENHNGCASYLCDRKTRVSPETIQPEIRLSALDLHNVMVPPKPQLRTAQEVTTPFLPPTATKINKIMIASVAVCVVSLSGLFGILTGNAGTLVLGFGLSVIALVLGVLSSVTIYTGKTSRGFVGAAISVFVSALLCVLYLGVLDRVKSQEYRQRFSALNLEESLPQEAELNKLEIPKANAMKANVVIETGQALSIQYGSGIILKIDNGTVFILTNKHVIENGDSPHIEITFFNGEKAPAKVEWRGPEDVDLAVLSCQTFSLNNTIGVKLFQDNLVQGTRVFAIGNPEKLPWSYTEGVISSIRTKKGTGGDLTIYQTQTPINFGNSGGGLYNMQGQLAGINTWTQDKSVSEGLNFSISAKSALALWSEQERKRFLSQ